MKENNAGQEERGGPRAGGGEGGFLQRAAQAPDQRRHGSLPCVHRTRQTNDQNLIDLDNNVRITRGKERWGW